ncbi:MAG: hypothetical protein ABRQ39_22760 [Candidatus Eremiobacterota bacterium]
MRKFLTIILFFIFFIFFTFIGCKEREENKTITPTVILSSSFTKTPLPPTLTQTPTISSFYTRYTKQPMPTETISAIQFGNPSEKLLPSNPTVTPAEKITLPEPYIFIIKWGNEGVKDGQFKFLRDITINSKGYVYVIDYDRIQKFDSSGNFITKWGSYGKSNGQFSCPFGISTDYKENIYITDSGNYRIQKFDSSGNFITKWGSYGDKNKEITDPKSIAVDKNGNVFVVSWQHYIHKFTPEGQSIKTWDIEEYNNTLGSHCDHHLEDIVIDPYGYIYVVNSLISASADDSIYECCIKKFDSNGKFILKWGSKHDQNAPFGGSIRIGMDFNGNIYVANMGNHCIQKFDPNGKLILKFGSYGTANGQFKNPSDIAIDNEGNIYVTDYGNHRVQKFKPNPEFKINKN